jgi:hypothetical protein
MRYWTIWNSTGMAWLMFEDRTDAAAADEDGGK